MRTLTLLLLALISLPASAEELQVTISGLACILAPTECGTGTYNTPFAISYDIDTASGQQAFHVGQSGFFNDGDILISYDASNLAVTNYSATLGGRSVASQAHTTGVFGFEVEGQNAYDFAGGAGSSKGSYEFDSFATPFVTASQLAAFEDPLAELLLKYRSTPAFCGGSCVLITGPDIFDFIPLEGTMTITPVPSPGSLMLSLAGLVALMLTRRREWTVRAQSDPEHMDQALIRSMAESYSGRADTSAG